MRLAALFPILVAGGCGTPRDLPFIVAPPVGHPRRIFASRECGWAARLVTLEGFADQVVPVRGAGTPAWPTDEWVFGRIGGKPAVLRMPGHRDPGPSEGLSPPSFSGRLLRPGRLRDWPLRRFDQGGNVLASPPIGERFPFGRIVVGKDMDEPLKEFFRRQGAQVGPDGLVEVDTSWLKVGHVDELLAFLPSDRGDGFFVAAPDPEAGLGLLEAVPPERLLFASGRGEASGGVTAAGTRFLEDGGRDFTGRAWKYVRIVSGTGAGQVGRISAAETHRIGIDLVWDLRGASPTAAVADARETRAETMPVWLEPPDATSRYVLAEESKMWIDAEGDPFPAMITAGELRRDEALREAASAAGHRIYGAGGVVDALVKALGIRPDRLVRLPTLFAPGLGGTGAWSLVPNPVNLVVLDRRVVVLRPFGPRNNPSDGECDVFSVAWRREFGSIGLETVLLDGWDVLHVRDGGAHCGTNALR